MRSATDTAGLTALVVITTDYLRTPGQDLDSFPDGYVSLSPKEKRNFPTRVSNTISVYLR
jgi:hypothetical protein